MFLVVRQGEDIAEDDDADFFSLLRKTRGMNKDDNDWWQTKEDSS